MDKTSNKLTNGLSTEMESVETEKGEWTKSRKKKLQKNMLNPSKNEYIVIILKTLFK